MFFSEKMLDHFEHPRNVGSMDEADLSVGTATITATQCGDVTKLQLRISDDGRIVDTRFKTFGCGAAIASGSLATEWLKGKTVDEALAITNANIAKELELPPAKVHCSVMTEEAVRDAVNDWKKKNGKL
ncbi:MAG: iron-sulfur cluster assembly scaffold protein [Planctomycetaceae bacterium]|nr:iron-sulfur cluster assembly scaffold protein [Planctomycetaceae bacterium]